MFRIKLFLFKIIPSTLLLSSIWVCASASDLSPLESQDLSSQPKIHWSGFSSHSELQKDLLCADCIKQVQKELREQTGFSVQGNLQLNVFNYFPVDVLKSMPNLGYLSPGLSERSLIDSMVSYSKGTKKLTVVIQGKSKDNLEDVPTEMLKQVMTYLEGEKVIHQPATVVLNQIHERQMEGAKNLEAISRLLSYLEAKELLDMPASHYFAEINKGKDIRFVISGKHEVNQGLQIISYFDSVSEGVLEDILRYSTTIYESSTLIRNEGCSDWSCWEDGMIGALTFIYREEPTLQFHVYANKQSGEETVDQETLIRFINALKKKDIVYGTMSLSTTSFAPIIVTGQQKISDTLNIFHDFKLIPDQVIDYIITHIVRIEDFRAH